jgi:hypothetical protein
LSIKLEILWHKKRLNPQTKYFEILSKEALEYLKGKKLQNQKTRFFHTLFLYFADRPCLKQNYFKTKKTHITRVW